MNSDGGGALSGHLDQGHPSDLTKSPDRGSDNLLAEFARSFAYTAAQRPVTGLAEIYDYFRHTTTAESLKFMDEPTAAEPFSDKWHAQTLGSAAGLLIPLVVAHRLAGGGKAGRIPAGALTAETAQLAHVSTGTALRRSAVTGLVLDGLMAPGGSEREGFWTRRLEHGLIGAVNFGGMTGAGIGLRYASSLRGLGFIAPIVRSHLGSNVAGGVLISPITTELTALQQGRHATAGDFGQSAYANALGGVAFGAFAKLAERRTVNAASEAAADPAAYAARSRSSLFGRTRESARSAWQSAREGASKFGEQANAMLWQVNPFRPFGDGMTPALAMAADTATGGGHRGRGAAISHEFFSKRVDPANNDVVMAGSGRRGLRGGGEVMTPRQSGVATQFLEPGAKGAVRTFSLDSVLKRSPDLEGHREAFARLKEEHPDDLKGLKAASLEPIAHGGDSLVIDLAPSKFVDADGNVYSRAVMKIMEAPQHPVAGRAWQTPEWKGEWGQRRRDLPLLRLADSESTVEPKEITIGGRRYYIFLQPKGEAYGGGSGKFADAAADAGQSKLEMEEGYHQLLKDLEEDGLVFLDEGSRQIVSWEMMEPDPQGSSRPPIKVKHFGVADYPSVGRKGEAESGANTSTRIPRREDSDYADDAQDPYGDRAEENLSEAEQLDRAGLHETEMRAPSGGDPVWLEMVEMIREYKQSRIPEKDIADTIRLLHEDYLKEHQITAEEAMRRAQKSR